MNDILTLPAGPLASASLTLVRKSESPGVADHSIRSFLFARLLAGREGCLADPAYDEDLLFAACVLHDIGLGTLAAGQARFEVEGADLAAALLTEHGVAAAGVDRVWEAIALHSSLGIAGRRGLLTRLTHIGIFTDFADDGGPFAGAVDAGLRGQVYAAYPRPAGDRSVRDAIAEHAARSPAAAPPFSIGAELLRQRRAQA